MPVSRRPAATLSKTDIVGNGFGFWKTIPIARADRDDVDAGAVDVDARRAVTSPSTRAPGISSCMRLMQRTSVDLPQPDGPMIAVTSFGRELEVDALDRLVVAVEGAQPLAA